MVVFMQFSALIYSVERDNFFTILIDGKKTYFYMQKHLVKNFYKYLRKGTYVTFEFEEQKAKYKKIFAYKVNYFIEFRKRNNKQEVYYDLSIVRDGIKSLVNLMNPIMFIDFEMNMQDYKPILGFEQEIIEAGLLVTDAFGVVSEVKHFYIKPTKFKRITTRAMKFLHYTKVVLDMAISYKEFYNELKKLIEKYNPYVVVWGKSDITQLKKSFEINKCEDLNLHFINLLQLHTNYDNLHEAPGLFTCYEAYTNTKLPEQAHNALEDAMVTKDVFFLFKNRISK